MVHKKKVWEMTVLLSLALGLTVPAWAAEVVEIERTEDRSSETGTNIFATAYGLTSQGIFEGGTSFEITVQALAGKNSSQRADASVYGISNSDPNIIITGNNTIKAIATGGSGTSSYYLFAQASAYGIDNDGTLTTENNTIVVTAVGGEAERIGTSSINAYAGADASASGINNDGTLTTENNTIVVTAMGGEAEQTGPGFASASTSAYGIDNDGTLTTGNNTIILTAIGGKAVSTGSGNTEAEAEAYGIRHGGTTLTTGDNTFTVTAIGGNSISSEGVILSALALAQGILNDGTLVTENNTIKVTAIGGESSSFISGAYNHAYAYGCGIFNSRSITTGINIITVTTRGGESSSVNSYSSAHARAYGIQNSGVFSTGTNTITATATGGKSSSINFYSVADAEVAGIINVGTMDTKENTIKVISMGGIAEGSSASAEATAVGMHSVNNGNITAVGSQNIYTEAVAGTANGTQGKSYTYALLARTGGTITLDSRGEAVKLTGDIGASGSSSIVLSLDNANSIWRPRFQDTYGGAENGSFGSGSFTMQDGGVLDLAWHSNLNGYNFKDSQLNLTGDTIQIGDGATFIVNADLANDVADTIWADTIATGTQYVRVAYDPSYLTYETVEGRALVLDFDGANGMGLASTVERPGSNVTFMPIMEGGYLVSLKRTDEPGIVGKVGSDSYHQQINILRTQWSNLVQRLGDVRNENPESHNGSWARIHGGKLKSDGAYNRKSTMKYGGVQAGYDRMRETGSGKYLAGFLVDYIDADSNFQRGEGNTQSLAFGGYWTWLSPKGHYADVVVKAAHLDTDYDFYYLSGEKASADFTNWGYTMSVEYGYRHDLKKNRYIEPQAQFLVGHLQSKSYQSSNGVSLHQDGVNLAMGRLGVLMGWTDENKSSAYVRGSVVHDFSGSGALTSSYEGDRMRIDTAGNTGTTFEVNMGANVTVGKNSHLYAELTKSFGGDVKTDWQANLGWRVKW